jgi:drug/metabolite transporter (DMT)-like permease
MLFIALSVLCSTILIVFFKIFERYNINTFQGILFNYFTCIACAWATTGQFPVPQDVSSKAWFPFALILGFCFITGFNAIGGTVKNFNMSLASVMQKMSLLFGVTFAFIFYNESITFLKISGIIASIGAIVMTSFSSDEVDTSNDTIQKQSIKNWLLFPFTAWILSGVIDILLLYVNKEINNDKTDVQFIATLFATAGCFGIIALIYGLVKGTMKFEFKNVIGGICLGIPNFFSIYFLLKSLSIGYDISTVFPVTNVGIIVLSTLSGYFFFKESLLRGKIIGIGLAILAIILMTF